MIKKTRAIVVRHELTVSEVIDLVLLHYTLYPHTDLTQFKVADVHSVCHDLLRQHGLDVLKTLTTKMYFYRQDVISALRGVVQL